MNEKTETTLVIIGAVVVALFAIYELTKPPPPSNDISWEQAGQFIAMIATYY